MSEIAIGIIGGSGLYQIDAMTDVSEVHIDTPFGAPSDAIITGTLEGKRVAFLPRHGKGHRLNPGEVPYRANISTIRTSAGGIHFSRSTKAIGVLISSSQCCPLM